MTKLEEAMRLVDTGVKPYQAAMRVGYKQGSAVYAEIKRRREAAKMVPCPCCGSLVKPEQIKSIGTKETPAPYLVEQIASDLEEKGAKAAADHVRKTFK